MKNVAARANLTIEIAITSIRLLEKEFEYRESFLNIDVYYLTLSESIAFPIFENIYTADTNGDLASHAQTRYHRFIIDSQGQIGSVHKSE